MDLPGGVGERADFAGLGSWREVVPERGVDSELHVAGVVGGRVVAAGALGGELVEVVRVPDEDGFWLARGA